jgi:hypothetical protein
MAYTLQVVNDLLSLDDRGIVCQIFAGNVLGKSMFLCKAGHTWVTSASSVLRGSGCSACAGNFPVSHEEVNRRLAGRGIKCVEYAGRVEGKSSFICAKGHVWNATASQPRHTRNWVPFMRGKR